MTKRRGRWVVLWADYWCGCKHRIFDEPGIMSFTNQTTIGRLGGP